MTLCKSIVPFSNCPSSAESACPCAVGGTAATPAFSPGVSAPPVPPVHQCRRHSHGRRVAHRPPAAGKSSDAGSGCSKYDAQSIRRSRSQNPSIASTGRPVNSGPPICASPVPRNKAAQFATECSTERGASGFWNNNCNTGSGSARIWYTRR